MSQLENNTSTLQTLLSTIETMEVMPNSVEQAIPTIEISSGGLITTSATQGAGVVAAGTITNTKQLTTKAAATITPGTSDQTIASGTYLIGTQTIAGDADLVSENIKDGVSIFGVTGSMESKEFTINATVESGATVTATSGSTTVTGMSNGTCTLKVPSAGTWTIMATTQLDEWDDELETSNSKSIVTVDTHSTSLTFFRAYINVTAPVGTEVSCTNGTKTYTATVTSDTVQFRVLTTGNWTVSATFDGDSESTVITVSEALTYNLPFFGSVSYTLNNNAWSVIKEISDAGTAANYWAVGDTHEVTINGTVGQTTFSSLSVYAFILGFDHNSSIEGTNRIHFQIGKTAQTGGTDIALVDSMSGSSSSTAGYFNMNYSNNNSGGWDNSKMRVELLGSLTPTPVDPLSGSLLAALPSDLRDVMKSCTKYSDNRGGGSNTAAYVTSTTDYLWLLAEYEVFGTRSFANSAEQNYQQQYTYYANGNSRVKYQHSSTSSTAYWWLRSTYATFSSRFCIVNTDGGASIYYAHSSHGVAPAFCV